MSARKTKSGKPRKGKAPQRKAQPEQPQPNGVIVALTPGPNGGEVCEFQLLGETKPRELPTLLREAAKAADAQLGLG